LALERWFPALPYTVALFLLGIGSALAQRAVCGDDAVSASRLNAKVRSRA
jgi:hypothetical protein